MADKKFVGSCKPGKFENQVDIGFQQKDIDEMQNAMKNGWVNIRLNRGRESGKPYLELVNRD